MDVKKLAELLQKLDSQSFRPGDSVIASTINHPIDAVGHGLDWLNQQVNTAVSPYAPSYQQAEAGTNLAGLAQLGSFPMAPKSAGGTLGTVTGFGGAEDIAKSLDDKFGDIVDAWVSGDKQGLKLDKLIVDKSRRGEGVGSLFMDDLASHADEQGETIRLMADGDFGGSKAKQKLFYKRAGFVENKGKNKDYSFSENMYRLPKRIESLLLPATILGFGMMPEDKNKQLAEALLNGN